MLGDADLRKLVGLWPDILNVVLESKRVPWRELFELVQAWHIPRHRFFRLSSSEIPLTGFCATSRVRCSKEWRRFPDDILASSIGLVSCLAMPGKLLN